MAEENIFKKEESPKAVLVSVFFKGEDERENEASLSELEQLLKTAGGEVFGVMTQSRETPDVRTYIGEGKVVFVGEAPEGSVDGCDGVRGAHKKRMNQRIAILLSLKAHDLGGASSDIDSDYNAHDGSFRFPVFMTYALSF